MSAIGAFFKKQGTTLRIAGGLVSLLITLLLIAGFIGLVPDRNAQVMEKRIAVAELIASNTSVFVSRSDLRRLEANLQFAMSRNPDILSGAVRNKSGKPVAMVGLHEGHWVEGGDSRSQLVVPIWAGESQWGQVELRYEPLSRGGILGFFLEPMSLLLVFMSLTSGLLFFFYLRKMLKHLDPSQAIPDRVRTALDTMAEGLLVLDAKQNVVLANEAFANIVDKSAASLLGKKASSFDWADADGKRLKLPDFPWTTALDRGISQRNKSIRLVSRGRPARTFQTNCSPVLTSEDKVGGVLVSFDDITALEEKETQLRLSKQEAEEANRAKSDFLANMSHEIRTPMNAIMGFTDLLKRAHLGLDNATSPQDSLQYLNTIANSSQHLLDLINDILDLSKVDAGRIEIELLPVSVHKIILEVISVMQGRADEKGLTLEFVPEGAQPETIEADPARLRQVFINLVGNAIKFTDEGSVRIVSRLSERAGEPSMVIDIVDTGIGMSEAQMSDIFSPFTQADSSITRRFGGTGLGLAICKRFAEAMGGDLAVSSEPGAGSSFSVAIPTGAMGTMVEAADLAALEPIQEASAGAAGRWQFAPAQVLVADDSPENRDLLEIVLQDHGLKVLTANDGQQALDVLGQKRFDIVLMDVQMPVMDGYAAVGNMRQQGLELPVIALTAHAMKGAKERCLAAGYTDYLSKPINFDELLARLAQDLTATWVDANPAPSGLESAPQQQAADPQSRQPASAAMPLFSTLPTEGGKFDKIIEKFVVRLQQQVAAMRAAFDEREYEVLKDIGHWMKGSPGSVGFHDFDQPGGELEEFALAADDAALQSTVEVLESLGARVVAAYEADKPAAANGVTAESEGGAVDMPGVLDDMPEIVRSDMARDARFRPLVEKFVVRLPAQLDSLEHALEHGDYRQVKDIAHWLKGTAGTVGLHAFTAPATELEQHAIAEVKEAVSSQLFYIRELHNRIELDDNVPSTQV